jgi:hypothetical protein
MSSNQDSRVVDKNKLTQRELLILLSNQMDTVTDDVKGLKKETPELRDRVTKIETRMVVTAAAFGALSIAITIAINFIKLFTNG